MKYIALLLSCAFLASCSTVKPVVDVLPIPAKPESSLPIVKTVDKDVSTLIVQNTQLSKKLETQKQNITEQKREIVEAIASAEKIKEKALAQVAITEIEAIDLIDQLNKIDSRNMFLEKENTELNKVNQEQEGTLREVKLNLTNAQSQIAVVEADSNAIRERLQATDKVLSNKNVEMEKLKGELTKEKQKSATASVYRNWVLGLASILILWIVLKVVVTIYFPFSGLKL